MDETSPERRAGHMYYVYILKSVNRNKTYVGSTKNVDRRLQDHNMGKSLFTSKFKPWKIILTEKAKSNSDARKREKFFKSGAGRKFIAKLLNNS